MRSQDTVKIRPATIEDSDELATLFITVWHISLKNLVPNDFLDQFQHERQKQKYVERAKDPHWIFLVAELQNKIVGMIAAKENIAEPLSFQREIKAMYVNPDFQRQGIGTLLFERILKELKTRGIQKAMLWCIEANFKACTFYEKHGGKRIENIPTPEEYSIVLHVIYQWSL